MIKCALFGFYCIHSIPPAATLIFDLQNLRRPGGILGPVMSRCRAVREMNLMEVSQILVGAAALLHICHQQWILQNALYVLGLNDH